MRQGPKASEQQKRVRWDAPGQTNLVFGMNESSRIERQVRNLGASDHSDPHVAGC